MKIRELDLSETIKDLEYQVADAKLQLQRDPDRVLRSFLEHRATHLSNIARWLKDYKRMCEAEADDRK